MTIDTESKIWMAGNFCFPEITQVITGEKMKASKILKLTLGIFVIFSLCMLSGCMMIADMGTNSMPPAGHVLSTLKPVDEGNSRIVIYWEPLFEAVGVAALNIILESQDGYAYTYAYDKTATIIDIPADKYTIKEINPDIAETATYADIDARSGKTYYFKVQRKIKAGIAHLNHKTGIIVPESQALTEMAKTDIRGWIPTVDGESFGYIPLGGKGFTAYDSNMTKKELHQKATDFNIKSTASRIYIIQNMGFGSNFAPIKAGLDGQANIVMKSKTYICYEVAPGDHLITTCHSWNKYAISTHKVTLDPGESCFFRIILAGKDFVDAATGQKLVKKSKLVKGGFLKSVQ